MPNTLVVLVFFLAFAASQALCNGQETVCVTTVSPSGETELVVRNTLAQPISAVFIHVDLLREKRRVSYGDIFYDSLYFAPAQLSISVNEQRVFTFGGGDTEANVVCRGTLLQDGTGLGDPTSLSRIWNRRALLQSQYEQLIDFLSGLGALDKLTAIAAIRKRTSPDPILRSSDHPNFSDDEVSAVHDFRETQRKANSDAAENLNHVLDSGSMTLELIRVRGILLARSTSLGAALRSRNGY